MHPCRGDVHRAWDGRGRDGFFLPAGSYLVEAQSGATAQATLTVLAPSAARNGVLAAPNPAGKGCQAVELWFEQGRPVEVSVYNTAGERVARFGVQAGGRARWSLSGVANGVYFVGARAEGARKPFFFKLAVAR